MGRAPCCDKANVKKGPWSPEEDSKLKDFIQKYGTGGNWIALPQRAGLSRCGKSCRLRWLNYLRPNIKHGDFSQEEDATICTLFANIGSRWSIIASQLPGRTDNDIKNYWNTKLKKKFFSIVSSQKKQQQQHQALLQQQHYFSSSSSSSSQANNIVVTPKMEPLSTAAAAGGFGSDTLSFASSSSAAATSAPLLRAPYYYHQQPQIEMSNMINFGSDLSCSSSGGSCTPITYGTTEQLDYDQCERINASAAGNDNYIYDIAGGMEDSNRPIFLGGGGGGIHVESSLDYTFEEIKHFLSSNSGCNFGNCS